MSIHLLFPESGVRFALSVEDAKRLLYSEIENGTKHIVFQNCDDREETLINRGYYSQIAVNYVIAFEGQNFCIIGDDKLGAFYPYTHSEYRSTIEGHFHPKFNLFRVLTGQKQEYEECL